MTRGCVLLASVLMLAVGPLTRASELDAQQPRHLPTLPPAADTVPVDATAADTAAAAADTAAADTLLTPKARALDRLRALPTTPIQRDPDQAEDEDEAEGEEVTTEDDAEPTDVEPTDVEPTGVEPTEVEATEAAGEETVVRRRAWTEEDEGHVFEERDVRSLLRGLEGYVTTEYEGDSAVFESADNRLRLMGTNRVSRDGFAIATDSLLVYTGETGLVCGYGNPVLTGDQEPVESDRVCYDMGRGLGMADGARTTFVQGGTWYVRGPENRVFVLDRDERSELYGRKTQFTSCDLPEPHYTFQAQSLKMVHDDVLVARNVTLRFEDVPVFWLPWMVQSMKPDRKSGLLTPQFGVNDIVRNSDGYNRRISNIGFYWAVNDYVSALVAGEWFSNNYTAMEGTVTYRWLRQFLEGRLAVKRYWRHADFGTGSREMSINTSNSWRPDERTRMQVTGNYSTSTAMVRDYSFDPMELNRQIASNASVDRSFDWGSITLGATRRQQITDDQINWTLPSLGLTLRPITLYSTDAGTQSLTWSGRASTDRRLREVNHELTPSARDQNVLSASGSHSLSFGRLSLSQGFNFRDETQGARPMGDGIEALTEVSNQEISWNTGLSYQQNLWAGTTLSPRITIQGRQIRRDTPTPLSGGGLFLTDGYVAEPNRVSAGASLATSLFGFWPGFGEYERIRHKVSPSLNWSYSPRPSTTELQDSVFGLRDLREQNRVGLSFNQTFEAKVQDRVDSDRGAVGRAEDAEDAEDAEAEAEDADAEDAEAALGTGELRRLPESRIVNLLSINTSTTFEYDFVRARREGRGFLTDQVSNSLRSDLLPGFQLGMTHSLFERGEAPEDGGLEPRKFRPFLTRLNASFSIDNDFWLFRQLGFGGDDTADDTTSHASRDDAADAADADEFDLDHRDAGRGSIIPQGGRSSMGMRTGSGWQASLNYSLERARPRPVTVPGLRAPETQQVVNGSLRFSPTEHWAVNWNTSYSFTTGEFSSHALTLTRDLHRWQANFDFIKAPNGNFAMQFRVHLLDNPDIDFDYHQRTDPSDRLREPQP